MLSRTAGCSGSGAVRGILAHFALADEPAPRLSLALVIGAVGFCGEIAVAPHHRRTGRHLRGGDPVDARLGPDPHILSILGLHMAIMAGTVFWLVRALLALVSGLALRYGRRPPRSPPQPSISRSGAAVPMVRSWIKMSIVLIAVMLDRPALTMRNVALAALATSLWARASRSGPKRSPPRAGRGPGRRSAPSSRQGPRRTRNGTMTAVRTARTRARVPAAIES